MKKLVVCLLLLLAAALSAADSLAGKWVGGIDTDRGQMQIGLELKMEKGMLSGAVKTPHGDWPVKSVSESKGTYTLTFDSGGQIGKMVGTVKDGSFAGQFDNSPQAKGTFSLARPKS